MPIKPKTDPAFMFALLHVLLHEVSRDRLDIPFLKRRTSSPYLIAPNGFYLRDPESRKPLIWDLKTGNAVVYDTSGTDPALEGAFSVSGLEVGPDDVEWSHEGTSARPAFAHLVEHVQPYSPDWAAVICDVSADTIRSTAQQYNDHAHVGEVMEVDGELMPFRPVAISLGKTVCNGWGGYPSQVEAVLIGLDGLSPHYQIRLVRQGSMDAMAVDVEIMPDAPDGATDRAAKAEQVRHHIKSIIGVSCDVKVKLPGEVPRSEGKAVRGVDLR